MEINTNESMASSVKFEEMPNQLEAVANQPLVPKIKSEPKTKVEKEQRLATLAEDTRHRLKRSALDIYYIGLNLLEAQSITEHGEFLPWLQREFGMGKTSVYEFIHVAKAFQSKLPIIGNLINNITPTALYKLAAPSTSELARDEAIEFVKAGKVVDPDVAKDLIKKHKSSRTPKTQQKAFPIAQPRAKNQVEAQALPEEKSQLKQATYNFVELTSTPQQDELHRVMAERDSYKGQLTALQMNNDQLELEILKLRSELTLLQSQYLRQNKEGLL